MVAPLLMLAGVAGSALLSYVPQIIDSLRATTPEKARAKLQPQYAMMVEQFIGRGMTRAMAHEAADEAIKVAVKEGMENQQLPPWVSDATNIAAMIGGGAALGGGKLLAKLAGKSKGAAEQVAAKFGGAKAATGATETAAGKVVLPDIAGLVGKTSAKADEGLPNISGLVGKSHVKPEPIATQLPPRSASAADDMPPAKPAPETPAPSPSYDDYKPSGKPLDPKARPDSKSLDYGDYNPAAPARPTATETISPFKPNKPPVSLPDRADVPQQAPRYKDDPGAMNMDAHIREQSAAIQRVKSIDDEIARLTTLRAPLARPQYTQDEFMG